MTNTEYLRLRRDNHRKRGQCINCVAKLPEGWEHSRCSKHLAAHREWTRAHRPSRRVQYWACRDVGVCINGCKAAAVRFSRCQQCRKKMAEALRRRRRGPGRVYPVTP